MAGLFSSLKVKVRSYYIVFPIVLHSSGTILRTLCHKSPKHHCIISKAVTSQFLCRMLQCGNAMQCNAMQCNVVRTDLNSQVQPLGPTV